VGACFIVKSAGVGAVAGAPGRAGLESEDEEGRRLSIADLVRSPRPLGTGTTAEAVAGEPATPPVRDPERPSLTGPARSRGGGW
jgi:hypothetical protein